MEIFPIVFSAMAVLAAGIVRGYSGFGFAMITVTSMSLVFPPAKVIPVILVLEVMASGWLLPKVWHQIDWRSLVWLFLGVAFGTPPGVYLLAHVPTAPMRAAIAVLVMFFTVLMLKDFTLKAMPGKGMTAGTGLVSGLFNGGAAIGGPPVILFYLSSPAGVGVSRASIIAYFMGTDSLAFGLGIFHGLVTFQTITLIGILIAPLFMGIYLGNRIFASNQTKAFRRNVLILLLLLSMAVLIKSIY